LFLHVCCAMWLQKVKWRLTFQMFSQQCNWGFQSSRMWCCITGWGIAHISKEHQEPLTHWCSVLLQKDIHLFIPLACAECDDSLPFSGAISISLCYVLFPATLPHQLFFHPLSPHLTIYFLVYLSILLFPNSYTGCFTTLGHNCRRWFPRSLWWKKFI